MFLPALTVLAFVSTSSAAAAVSNTSSLTASSALDRYPFTTAMNQNIEGASVDKHGNFYAVNATTFRNLATGDVLLTGTSQGVGQYASSRFTRTLGTLVSDALNYTIYDIESAGQPPSVLISNPEILPPNDMAITRNERFIYISGQNFPDTTTAGEDGELLYYDTRTRSLNAVDETVLAAADIHRTNGIELSPDDRTLYITSAQNVNGAITSAKLYAFDIDAVGGTPSNPREVLDLYAAVPGAQKAQMDPDGMRADAEGTLFLALNLLPQVLMWTPGPTSRDGGPEARLIDLQTVVAPSNLELAGSNGKELFIIGDCDGHQTSCIDVFQHGVAGRAWTNLQGA